MKKKVDLSHLKDDWDFYDDLIMKLGLEEPKLHQVYARSEEELLREARGHIYVDSDEFDEDLEDERLKLNYSGPGYYDFVDNYSYDYDTEVVRIDKILENFHFFSEWRVYPTDFFGNEVLFDLDKFKKSLFEEVGGYLWGLYYPNRNYDSLELRNVVIIENKNYKDDDIIDYLIENGYGMSWTGKDVAEMDHGEILDFCYKWELLEDYRDLMWRNDPKEIVIKIKAVD